MHNFALPTELALEKLITQVYEDGRPADQTRLSIIESQILQKAIRNNSKNLNKIPWWIVLILVGGFATAAWWAGGVYVDKENTHNQTVTSDKIGEAMNRENSDALNLENELQESKPYEDSDSRVIYQRENF